MAELLADFWQDDPFTLDRVRALSYATPFFLLNASIVLGAYERFLAAFPGARIHYAMKASSEEAVLRELHAAGCGFEVASIYEWEMLDRLSVSPQSVIYGTAVKPSDQIAAANAAGITTFAADSFGELHKLAAMAPGAAVYVRVGTEANDSVYQMSHKFGAPVEEALPLLLEARELGLHPCGLSFNVGSQARSAAPWRHAIERLTPTVKAAISKGIAVDVLNVGGGFPHPYASDPHAPSPEEIAAEVFGGLADWPVQPVLILEPGRGLVASSSILVSTVIARIERRGQPWLYLDAGVYNALFEALSCQGAIDYRVTAINSTDDASECFVLAGPTGDGLDVISNEIMLSAATAKGDRLLFHDVGAYTRCFATAFNGFPQAALHLA
jgi:ornithine decarboxylase